LKAKPALNRIKDKIEALENVSDNDSKVELSKMEKGTTFGRSKGVKKPEPFKGSLEPWIKKDNIIRNFGSSEIGADVFEPIFHGFSVM